MKLLAATVVAALVLAAPSAHAESATPAPVSDVGRGVGVGLEAGMWGRSFASSLRMRAPLGERWGIVVRATAVHDVLTDSGPTAGIGSLEVFGQSRVYRDVVRIYAAGGPRLAVQLSGTARGERFVGFGGYAGLEGFVLPRLSLYLEIGGTTGIASATGATGAGGLAFYL